MLNKRQARHTNRAIRLKVFYNKNTKLVGLFKPMQREVAAFLINLGLIEAELPEKDTHGKSETEAKDELKKKVAQEAGDICTIAESYAVATGNTEVMAATGCSGADVLKVKDSELQGFVTKIVNVLMPLTTDEVFAEYGITAEMLTALQTDAQTFNDALGQGSVIDHDSSVANLNIDAAIEAIIKNIEQFDRLILFYKKTNPDFVKAYNGCKKLGDAGVKHSGVAGKLVKKESEEPVEKGMVRLADTNKQALVKLTGVYEIIKVKPGDYKLEVLVDNVVVASKVIHISRGKVMELDMAI